MSFRYEIIIEKNNKEVNYIQLFGNNDYIKEVHDYIKNKFNLENDLENDLDFEVHLSKNKLNELYKIIDEYCLGLARQKDYRYIDVLKNHTDDYGDFGLYNLSYNNYYVLQSARLCKFLVDSEGIDNFCCPFHILDDYKVIFKYS